MIVLLINTFNKPHYLEHARACLNAVREQLRCSAVNIYTVVVCGGCPTNMIVSEEGASYINIEENLSDHNVYVGFERYVERFQSEEFSKATYVHIHDTCRPTLYFRQRIEDLDEFPFRSENAEWIFASTYGLYNIGICNYAFMLRRAKDFEGITFISKEDSLHIEGGSSVRIQDKIVPTLKSYSKYMLSAMCKEYVTDMDIYNVDMYGINILKMHDCVRSVCYISSLGIYKLYSSKYTFNIPIWCCLQHHPHSEKEYNILDKFTKKYMRNAFVPMVSYFDNKNKCKLEER